ncbi:MAG: hypothetical protein KU29_03310 [Sulfurovum sp. FS06-10]|nr:MAG: hypothetical protein KU29_03310 [Sulfurovum sp. FS06-10]
MLEKLIFGFIVVFVTFCFGFLMGGLSMAFPFIEKAFWEAKITDYFSLLLTLVVGGGAAYLVSHTIEKNNHDAIVIDSLIDKLELELSKLQEYTILFLENKSGKNFVQQEDLSQITFAFKTISSMLTVVENATNNKEKRTRELFDALKASITDKNFTLAMRPFSLIQQKKIQDLFLQFKIQLYNVKISSFK